MHKPMGIERDHNPTLNTIMQNLQHIFVYVAILGLFAMQACQRSQPESGAGQGQTPNAAEGVAAEHPCAHCGMIYEKYPKWHATVATADEGTLYYCSNRCMFVHLLESDPPKDIESVRVVDYYDLKDIDGLEAFYVVGSDVVGPMGKGFVALSGKEAAETFSKEHKGQKVLKFGEVTLGDVKMMMQHNH